jgi:hypothetical protein
MIGSSTAAGYGAGPPRATQKWAGDGRKSVWEIAPRIRKNQQKPRTISIIRGFALQLAADYFQIISATVLPAGMNGITCSL